MLTNLLIKLLAVLFKCINNCDQNYSNRFMKLVINEMSEIGFEVNYQLSIPIIYKGKELSNHLKLDLLVDELLIAIKQLIPLYQTHLLTHLKLTGITKGLILNFNYENITKQLTPKITDVNCKAARVINIKKPICKFTKQ